RRGLDAGRCRMKAIVRDGSGRGNGGRRHSRSDVRYLRRRHRKPVRGSGSSWRNAGGRRRATRGTADRRPGGRLVVVSDRAQLGEIARRVRDGRLRTNIGQVATLDDAVAAFNATSGSTERRSSAFVREDSGDSNRSFPVMFSTVLQEGRRPPGPA